MESGRKDGIIIFFPPSKAIYMALVLLKKFNKEGKQSGREKNMEEFLPRLPDW